MQPPDCQCHGEPMTRRNDRTRRWRCSIAHRAAQGRYLLTRAGREAQRDQTLRRSIKASEARIVAKLEEFEALFTRAADATASPEVTPQSRYFDHGPECPSCNGDRHAV